MARIGAGRVFAYPADFSRGVKVRHAVCYPHRGMHDGATRLRCPVPAAGLACFVWPVHGNTRRTRLLSRSVDSALTRG